MESYNRGASNAPPHYSDLSNPQIIETLQKQGGYNNQDEGQAETQSNNENQEGKRVHRKQGISTIFSYF
jgi:hypothetical protein